MYPFAGNTRAIFPGPSSPRFESIIDLLCRTVARRVLSPTEIAAQLGRIGEEWARFNDRKLGFG
jgi:hypothetical protein